jgi:AP-1 complex subunit beta-1
MLQVQLQLVSAAVKLFLKKPTGKPQAMIQLVLTYATQVGTHTPRPELRRLLAFSRRCAAAARPRR